MDPASQCQYQAARGIQTLTSRVASPCLFLIYFVTKTSSGTSRALENPVRIETRECRGHANLSTLFSIISHTFGQSVRIGEILDMIII